MDPERKALMRKVPMATEPMATEPRATEPMATELSPLLDRRLIIVTGKGGTGKTTVAAAIAVAAAREGRSVLIAEVGGDEQVPQFIAPGHPPVGYAGSELLPGLTSIHIDPHQALAEYLGLQLRVPGIVDLMLRNKGFAQLLDAAPGWRELITLGKVWHLAQMKDAHGRALYELIVVDAPATGHGLTFLDVPRVVGSAVRAGPLRSHAHLVEELVRDPEQTLLLPVSLAEELPARETAELVQRAQGDLGISIDRIVVNAVAPHPFPPDVPEDLDERLRGLGDMEFGGLPRPRVLACCAEYLRARHELNSHYVEQIRRECGQPLVTLPYRTGGLVGADSLAEFAAPLLSAESAT
jgi:anion-transporting  ArsA/GET3 family ATPase